jgi:hypothetical protein
MERCAGATRESLHAGRESVSDSLFVIKRRPRRHRLTVSGMGIDGLEKSQGDPDVDGDYVQVLPDPAVEQWSENCPRSEDHDLERMRVLGGETEGRRILVVELVDMFVKQGCVEELMSCGNREGASERAGEQRTAKNEQK